MSYDNELQIRVQQRELKQRRNALCMAIRVLVRNRKYVTASIIEEKNDEHNKYLLIKMYLLQLTTHKQSKNLLSFYAIIPSLSCYHYFFLLA